MKDGNTAELRRTLKAEIFPLLTERGFAIDQRHAPQFIDFRRARSDQVDFIEFQWEKRGKPRFKLMFGSVGAKGTVASGMHTPAENVGPGQAPRYVRLYPTGNGSSTRHWLCQDAPFWARLFGSGPRPPSEVTAELARLLPEIDAYFLEKRIGPHCIEHANPPFANMV